MASAAPGGSRSSRPKPPTARGVEELADRLEEHREHLRSAGELELRRGRHLRSEVLAIAAARMRRRLEEEISDDPRFQDLLEEVLQRRLDPASAAGALLEWQYQP